MSKQTAKTIRTELKTAGYNARQISVRADGCAIYLTVRDPSVKAHKVKAIANKYVNVRYCEGSGEMLLGGNTFVYVEYAKEIIEQRAAIMLPILSTIEQGKDLIIEGVRACRPIDRTGRDRIYVSVGNSNGPGFDSCHTAARAVALAILDGGVSECGMFYPIA